MATDSFTVDSIDSGVHNTLTTTTADAVTVTCPVTSRLQVISRLLPTVTSYGIYVRTTGTAVAAADVNRFIPPGGVFTWNAGSGVTVVSVVSADGSSVAYSVQGMPYGTYS